MPHAHPLDALDARIRHVLTERANAQRFGEAYWRADDELALLRMARDEFVRTGAVRPEVEAILDAAPVAVPAEPHRQTVALAVRPVDAVAADDARPEPERATDGVAVGAA